MSTLTREQADRIARQAARRAEGDGARLLEHVSQLDPEVALAIRQRLAELGAQVLAASVTQAAT